MEPVLQRLGDVTIQKLEKPKESEPLTSKNDRGIRIPNPMEPEHDHSDDSYVSDEDSSENIDDKEEDIPFIPSHVRKSLPNPSSSTQSLKRDLPLPGLNLGPEISFKKFKHDLKPPQTVQDKNVDSDISSDDELPFYDSDLESEAEELDFSGNLDTGLKKNVKLNAALELPSKSAKLDIPNASSVLPNNLSQSLKPHSSFDSLKSTPTKVGEEESNNEDEEDESLFEKLVEQAEVPPPTPSTPSVKNESVDDDYEVDIKEKLKEMGEITFASVKKGEKPKSSEGEKTENEVVITKKSGEEVTVMSKGNLRRNIREVMDETKLDETTLAAQRQEAERLKRVQEQQRILREYQRQTQQERMQQRVMSLLQGNNFPKPGPSHQTRIGNTVLVKLPNGQTKPMTKVSRPPFDLLKMPKPETTQSRFPQQGPSGASMGPSRNFPRGPFPPYRRGPQPSIPPNYSPLSSRGPSILQKTPESDSDSDIEIDKSSSSTPIKSPKGKTIDDNQPIEVSSDDDCILVSESEADAAPEEDENEDPSNSGMHTNDVFNQPDEQGRVLVNVGHSEDDPDVFVAPQIAKIIKPHQIGGVRFLYDNIVETITRFDSSAGFGCILAHSMGLGKTLQIVTFSDVFLRYTPARTILCIMPINTLQNWLAEYNMWTPTPEAVANNALNTHGEVLPRNFNLYVLNDSQKTLGGRHKVIHEWKAHGGVLLIGYEQFRLLSMKKHPKTKRKAAPVLEIVDTDKNKVIFDEIYTALVNPGPDLVICDEGHRIKNSHASISTALKQLRTKRRVVLTGYPLQNNLTEYWCMVDFVRPNYLGSKTEFLNMFERPIMNGQCIDSTEADIKLMRYRAHVLHSLLVGFVQRRSHTVLQTVLPQKEEYVLLVRLTPFQRSLYDRFMNDVVRVQTVPNPLKAFAVCCKIWNHPDVLYNFLMKTAKGEAVDLDLEEVASTVNGVTGDAKPRRGPGKPRKVPAKGRNGKPAASVTPYNSNNSELPANSTQESVPIINSQSTNPSQFPGNTTASSFPNNFSRGGDIYGPYTDEFNQPRTSFEGISQFFDDHVSRPSYENSTSRFPQFNSTTDFNSSQPQSSNSGYQQSNQQNRNVFGDGSNSQQPPFSQNLFNLDSQNNVSVTGVANKTNSNIPMLPSGISLTPLNSKNQIYEQNNAPGQHQGDPRPDNGNAPFFGSQTIDTFNRPFGYDQSFQSNVDQQRDYWNLENKPEFNQQGSFNQGNSFDPNNPLWIKKEEPSFKGESSNDSKPKINIISDIKLPSVFPSDKKINIISDIKIEPKKEAEDKYGVKRELEKIKNELKNELKIEDDVKPPAINESPLSKLAASPAPRDTKDDSIPYDWAFDLLKDYIPGQIENSAKFQILFCIIRESLALGDRLLVFSQSLIALDLIEYFLQISEVPGESYKWAKNSSYYRLDGSTGAQEREKLINEFNSNPKIHLFLVSTRAGSLGINLIGANRVVVLDASWNPCHDTQAVCRVYRYGQRKPCFVYRLVMDNCLEKKIYDRQVSKQGMSDRVVDECNPDAHLTIKDVTSLCFDDKKEEGEIKDWSSCKDKYIDVVLQKVLDIHGTLLTKEPFQHESLLVDRKEKKLSQQEKRLAKKGYEREKNAARQPSYLGSMGRGHRPIASVRPMQQGVNDRPSRWIPAEHWQRQGMTAQEMTLPLDVVIPTNQPEKGNIVLKAGQKVLVLKSPKGVYMQLESGKIVAIKTAIKVKGKAEENGPLDSMKMTPASRSSYMPPQVKNNPALSVLKRPQKPPIIPGMAKFNVKSVQRTVPNLVSKIQSVNRKIQNLPGKQKPYQIGNEIAKSLRESGARPFNSTEDESLMEQSRQQPDQEGADDLEKKISQLKKNISIQRVTPGGAKQPLKTAASNQSPSSSSFQYGQLQKDHRPPLQNEFQSQTRVSLKDQFQDTLENITADFKNSDNLGSDLDDDDEEQQNEEPDDEEVSDESTEQNKQPALGEPQETIDQNDEVAYVSEQHSEPTNQRYHQQKFDNPAEYSNANTGYNYNYNYNIPPYQNHPPPVQGYGYPVQHPLPYDSCSGYPHGQPMYNYGYQGYPPPPPQPHYPPPPPPQTPYDYNSAAGVYPSYPYPQQYPPPPPPPQGMYPTTANAPPTSYPDYSQYPNQSQSNTNYYQDG
ncbi:hypothetical protein ABEB36_008285 [Hypothenemus hampei]|uniref:Helicase ARIP4 n=1 Tax=Hypothenemus hampei TaxID=57062 RepID=A0ABD1ELC8_HYPHA